MARKESDDKFRKTERSSGGSVVGTVPYGSTGTGFVTGRLMMVEDDGRLDEPIVTLFSDIYSDLGGDVDDDSGVSDFRFVTLREFRLDQNHIPVRQSLQHINTATYQYELCQVCIYCIFTMNMKTAFVSQFQRRESRFRRGKIDGC
jgi:hypothetical protein